MAVSGVGARTSIKSPGRVGGAAALAALLLLCGCASAPRRLTVLSREAGPLPATLPPDTVFQRSRAKEMGPPPYGYIRILANAIPNWEEGAEPEGGPNWTFLGPQPVASEFWSGDTNAGGRVNSIAPHPTDINVCYVVTDGGGLWKTTDGGANWSPLTDHLSILTGGAVALSPQNASTVYYGTGDQKTGSRGDGLFRSTNAGASWTRVGTTAQVGDQVNHIALHPTNGNIIHVAGSGGYRRSLDGGNTWTTPLGGSAAWQVLLASDNPSTVYVSRDGQGVYKSTDGGTTFGKLGGGLPTGGISRVEIAISRSNPSVLYTAFIDSLGSDALGVWRTSDAGATWTQTAYVNFCFPQCYYDAYIGVDPTNENVVFLGGVDSRYADAGILRSTNGGQSWQEVANSPTVVHPDHHCIAWGPSGIIWEGNDGGVYKSLNGGTSWQNLNATLGAAQLYDIEVHPTLPDRMLGGTQDNGTPERNGPNLTWPQLQIGDGGMSVFDPNNVNRRYTTYVYLQISRWVASNLPDFISGPWGSDPRNWISPFIGHPTNSSILLAGTNRVWKTTNATLGTVTWFPISQDNVGGSSAINALAMAPSDPDVVYAGNGDGDVWVSDGGNFTNRSTGLPNGQISDIIINPADPANAYVTYFNTSGGRIYRTTNSGMGWINVTGQLPAGVAVTALEVDFDAPGGVVLYAGSGSGVYFTSDAGTTWVKDNATLPNANVTDLYIDRATRTITAATYGRGAWRAPLAGCLPDLTTTAVQGQTGYGTPNGLLNTDDFFYFLVQYAAGNVVVCDFTSTAVVGQPGYGVPNGVVTSDDFFFYLNLYSAGC